jgi:CubicO group peptidase (beta-lactamase class C family)
MRTRAFDSFFSPVILLVVAVSVAEARPAIALQTQLAMAASKPAPIDLAADARVAEALHLLDLWVAAERDWKRIPAVSVGVVHDQTLVWSKGYGFAHVDRRVAASPATIYSICSISKLFTSISIMQLRDQGKLSLSDPVTKHLAWFDQRWPDAHAPPVTIEGLLTHSAGLAREAEMPYWADASTLATAGQPPRDYAFPSRDDLLRAVPGRPVLFPPSSYYQYSNLGLTLAGEIVAARSGMDWGDYVKKNILDPLGMKDTFTEIPVQHRDGRYATGYSGMPREGDRVVMPFFQVNGFRPAFGMASTVEDLAKFASWQLRALDYRTTDVLNGNTLSEMQRVHWMDPDGSALRGIGFAISVRDSKTFVGHGGSCPGHRTQLDLQTREKIATIAMSNGGDINTGAFTRMAYNIVGPSLRRAADPAAVPAKPADPLLQKYTGVYGTGLGGETAVIVWDGQLALVSLPAEDPLGSMTRLRHVEGDTFRRVRRDGQLAEPYRFELGPDGRARRFVHFENYSNRLR